MRWALLSVLLLCVSACAGEPPEALGLAAEGTGPKIVYEPLHLADPELPLPNDAATRVDLSSHTGRRLNLSETVSPLAAERRLRRKLNRLDGWSVFAPITVSFDAPLDLATVTDDSVVLVDVTPSSPEYRTRIPLDLGRGAFPTTARPRGLFPYDLNAAVPNLLFPADNGPNDHWETASRTLLIRPLRSLRAKTTYAVVLTRAIRGTNGQPVRSPFVGTNAAAQTETLRPAAEVLPGGAASVAFAWAFTTQSIADDLIQVREGLDGRGALAGLRDRFPPKLVDLTNLGFDHDGDGSLSAEGLPEVPGDHRYLLQPGFLKKLLGPFGAVGYGLDTIDLSNIAYFVYGHIEAPDLRDVHGDFWPDVATATPARIPFTLSVPKPRAGRSAPFPVVLYCHGARTSRFELSLVANALASRGFAMMGLDAVGHGPFGGSLRDVIRTQAAQFPEELVAAVLGTVGQTLFGGSYSFDGKSLDQVLADLAANGLWQTVFLDGRAKDLDGDGVLLSGDGYFVPDPFQMSANGRQTIVETLFLQRVLRAFDAAAVPKVPLPNPRTASDAELLPYLLAGDFNADGVLDVGGAANQYAIAGTSLGGIHASMVLALEPTLLTGVPIVSGGGMLDILLRTRLYGVVDPVIAELVGQAIVGCPISEGTSVSLMHAAGECKDPAVVAKAELGRLSAVPGGTVTVENPRLLAAPVRLEEARNTVTVGKSGGFSLNVAADRGDVLVLTVRDASGAIVGAPLSLTATHDGLGRVRNTPRFRRVLQVAQTALDRGDPIAWARYLVREPLPGSPPKNVLHLTDIGDDTVPFPTMVAWDRSVGLHGLTDVAAATVTAAFVSNDTFLSDTIFDFDNLHGTSTGPGRLTPITTASGKSTVRHVPIGKHEYIAAPDPKAAFDWATYSRNQLVRFIDTAGQVVDDDVCLEDGTCPWMK